MIPRFSYSFSLRQAWQALTDLNKEPLSNEAHYHSLFPTSTAYELNSARQGLTICLNALQLGKNARIGVQPYTCSSVLVAIEAAGCRPVFIDINENLTLNVDDLARKVAELDALVVTHTFGIAADIIAIKKVTGTLPVIEDCAHAFLCKAKGEYLGTQFDLSVFSFGNGKFPALGGGGLLLVNKPVYNGLVSSAVNQLRKSSIASEVLFISRQLAYSVIFSRIGYQLRHTFAQSYSQKSSANVDRKVASASTIPAVVKRRIGREWPAFAIAAARQRQLAMTTMNVPAPYLHWVYNPDPASNCFMLVCLTSERDQLYDFLVDRGIGAAKHFQHAQSWATAFGYVKGSCPLFEHLLPQILTIPCNYTLTKQDEMRIEQALADYGQIRSSPARKAQTV